MNYFINFKATLNGVLRDVDVVVYKDLTGTFHLNSVAYHDNGLIDLAGPGGRNPIDVHDADVIAAAHFAANMLDSSADVSDVNILSAQYQVVAGMNYFINFKATLNGVLRDVDVVVYKDLTGTFHLNSVAYHDNGIFADLVATAISFAGPGGRNPIDVHDADVIAAAHFAANMLDSSADVSDVNILSAQYQVVAGMNYFINFKATLNGVLRDVDVVVYKDLTGTFHLNSVAYHDNGIFADIMAYIAFAGPGGKQDVPVDDIEGAKACRFAANLINAHQAVADLTILSIQVQIVAGKNYFCDMKGTIQGELSDITSTVFEDLSGEMHVVSYDLNPIELVVEFVSERVSVGGKMPIDSNNPDAVKACRFAATAVNSHEDVDDLSIVTVEYQIVAGKNWYCDMTGTFGDQYSRVDAVVYQSLDDSYKVVSYDKSPVIILN